MPFELYHYRELESTNLQASALLSSRITDLPFVVCADYQTGGRGQGSNRWESERSANLLCSYVIFPHDLKIKDYFNLSVMASLAVAGCLDEFCNETRIKWPNDVFASGGKIAGILIENAFQGESIQRSIIGIGINVNQTRFPEFSYPAASLAGIHKRQFMTDLVQERLNENFNRQFHELQSGNFLHMKDAYLSKLYGLNELHWFRGKGEKFRAWIRGIDENGELLTEIAGGKMSAWGFKEIEYLQFQKE
jgi:BirA family biotin operon repressor/biotin-[acetyl-CoA-carboxylase] ligase